MHAIILISFRIRYKTLNKINVSFILIPLHECLFVAFVVLFDSHRYLKTWYFIFTYFYKLLCLCFLQFSYNNSEFTYILLTHWIHLIFFIHFFIMIKHVSSDFICDIVYFRLVLPVGAEITVRQKSLL